MNIVVINDYAEVNGGASKLAILEAAGLARQGHRIFFVCAVGVIDERLLHANITVLSTGQHDLLGNPNRLQAFGQGWWNHKASEMTNQLLSRLNPDHTVVHLHLWAKALSSSVPHAILTAGFAIVCTVHDFQLACPTGTFFLHPQQAICHLKPLSFACLTTNCDGRNYAQKLWRVGRQIIQNNICSLSRDIKHFIVHSALTEEVISPYLSTEATIHRLPCYIEGTQEQPASPRHSLQLAYLGRLVPEKGVVSLARCAAAEQFPICFIGSGPQEREIKEVNPDVEITGWVDYATSLKHLRKARALVFSSLWQETLGLVVLEAAAHGIPCLVPDTSAAKELVIDGVTGFHFKQGNADDLRKKMRLLHDDDVVASLGHRAYDNFWASDFPSESAHVQSLLRIYKTVLSGMNLHVATAAHQEVTA